MEHTIIYDIVRDGYRDWGMAALPLVGLVGLAVFAWRSYWTSGFTAPRLWLKGREAVVVGVGALLAVSMLVTVDPLLEHLRIRRLAFDGLCTQTVQGELKVYRVECIRPHGTMCGVRIVTKALNVWVGPHGPAYTAGSLAILDHRIQKAKVVRIRICPGSEIIRFEVWR